MKFKTSELTGYHLNYAVSLAIRKSNCHLTAIDLIPCVVIMNNQAIVYYDPEHD